MNPHPDPHEAVLQSPLPSPCISLCEMAPETGLCRGCLRTIDEIIGWRHASEDDKRAVWALIRLREARPRFDREK